MKVGVDKANAGPIFILFNSIQYPMRSHLVLRGRSSARTAETRENVSTLPSLKGNPENDEKNTKPRKFNEDKMTSSSVFSRTHDFFSFSCIVAQWQHCGAAALPPHRRPGATGNAAAQPVLQRCRYQLFLKVFT